LAGQDADGQLLAGQVGAGQLEAFCGLCLVLVDHAGRLVGPSRLELLQGVLLEVLVGLARGVVVGGHRGIHAPVCQCSSTASTSGTRSMHERGCVFPPVPALGSARGLCLITGPQSTSATTSSIDACTASGR